MYSYEERLRAVKLYLTLGKRCKATILQLGYPTKNALKAWNDEFERRGYLQAGYARSNRSTRTSKGTWRLSIGQIMGAASPSP